MLKLFRVTERNYYAAQDKYDAFAAVLRDNDVDLYEQNKVSEIYDEQFDPEFFDELKPHDMIIGEYDEDCYDRVLVSDILMHCTKAGLAYSFPPL